MSSRRAVVAEILTTGTEILMGKVVNTNASWLARRLTEMGVVVRRATSVPDDVDEIASCVREALGRGVDLLVVTGGLGPSRDDVTGEAIARALGLRCSLNEAALDMVAERLRARGLELTESRAKMAMMPEGATPIPNPVGVAPGVLIEAGGALVVALPGVPREMRAMFNEHVAPLVRRLSRGSLVEGSVVVRGLPESDLAQALVSLTEGLECDVYVKTRVVSPGVVEVYVTATRSECRGALAELIEAVKREVVRMGGEIVSARLSGPAR